MIWPQTPLDIGGSDMDAEACNPIGIYHPTTVNDATARELDGTAYVECYELETRNAAVRAEIRLITGQWILVDPHRDLIPGFFLDADPEHIYLATGYGEDWNTWAAPVIDRGTLQDLLERTGEPHRWDGDAVWIADDDEPFRPEAGGTFDTRFLGWTFRRCPAC